MAENRMSSPPRPPDAASGFQRRFHPPRAPNAGLICAPAFSGATSWHCLRRMQKTSAPLREDACKANCCMANLQKDLLIAFQGVSSKSQNMGYSIQVYHGEGKLTNTTGKSCTSTTSSHVFCLGFRTIPSTISWHSLKRRQGTNTMAGR